MGKKKKKREKEKREREREKEKETRTKTSMRTKTASKSPRRAPRKNAPTARIGSAARLNAVTHTELASSDPAATRAWCESVLGWKFDRAMPTPAGPYHMWQTKMGTGGGIRANNPPEVPGSIPYVEVKDIKAAFEKAISSGAVEMFAPDKLPSDAGWIAIVAAPGGVPIGFWAKK